MMPYCPDCNALVSEDDLVHTCQGEHLALAGLRRRTTTLEAAVIQLQEQCQELAVRAGERQGDVENRVKALEEWQRKAEQFKFPTP